MDFDFMVHLEDLSLEELKKLIDNEGKISNFIMDDEQLNRVKLQREMIMAANRSIAEDNLGKEPRLLQLKSDLGSKYTQLKELQETYQTNQVKIASLSKEENLDAMLAVLEAKSAQCEEITENLTETLTTNQIEVTEFISQFTELRKVAHLRHAKVDKMKELVLDIRRKEVHNTSPYPAAPKPAARRTSNPVAPTNATPYPAYPGYRHHSVTSGPGFPPVPQQPYPPPQQPQYPEYSW